MTFTLAMLGTKTDYLSIYAAPQNGYPHGETLSLLIRTIDSGEDIPVIENDQVEHESKQFSKIINGPDLRGSNVYDRIQRGILSCLAAICRGEKQINLIAHSRGSCESILIAHELDRLNTFFLNLDLNTHSHPQILSQMNQTIVKNLTMTFDFSIQEITLLHQQFQGLKLALFLIDPVPGGAIYGVQGLAWQDSLLHTLPSIVDDFEAYIYINELSHGFQPIQIRNLKPHQHIYPLLGHHGTGSGNPLCQRKYHHQQINLDATRSVQNYLLCKGIEFLQKNQVQFRISDRQNAPEWIYDSLDFIDSILSSPELLKIKKIESLNTMVLNENTFNYFNSTNYFFLGQDYKISDYFWSFLGHKKTFTRYMDIGNGQSAPIETLIPIENSSIFVNKEHLHLFLESTLNHLQLHDAFANIQSLQALYANCYSTLSQASKEKNERFKRAEQFLEIQDQLIPFGLNIISSIITHKKIELSEALIIKHIHDFFQTTQLLDNLLGNDYFFSTYKSGLNIIIANRILELKSAIIERDEIINPISLLISDFIKYLRVIGRYEHLALKLESQPRVHLIKLLKLMQDISNQLVFNEADEQNREIYIAIKQLELLYSKITRQIKDGIQIDNFKQNFSSLHQRVIEASHLQRLIHQLNPELCSEPFSIQLQDYKHQLLELMYVQIKSENYSKKVLYIIAALASIVTAGLIIHFQLGMIALGISLIMLAANLLYKKLTVNDFNLFQSSKESIFNQLHQSEQMPGL